MRINPHLSVSRLQLCHPFFSLGSKTLEMLSLVLSVFSEVTGPWLLKRDNFLSFILEGNLKQ